MMKLNATGPCYSSPFREAISYVRSQETLYLIWTKATLHRRCTCIDPHNILSCSNWLPLTAPLSLYLPATCTCQGLTNQRGPSINLTKSSQSDWWTHMLIFLPRGDETGHSHPFTSDREFCVSYPLSDGYLIYFLQQLHSRFNYPNHPSFG